MAMTITVKIVDENGNVTAKDLKDDPSIPEISEALGGTDQDNVITIGEFHGWEICQIRSSDDMLVIGSSPRLGAEPAERKSCDISDVNIEKICSYFRKMIEERLQEASD